MKALMLLLFSFCYFSLHSQVIKKYSIGDSGSSIYMLCEPMFKVNHSQDSSLVYTGDCQIDNVMYSLIFVKLLNQVDDLNLAESLLISYMDFLKKEFGILSAAGYGKGHRLNNDENTRGVIDYWKDEDGQNWKVKGWANRKSIAVLYTYSKLELPESKVNLFLESLRFAN
jgi:hypothetical protein